MGFSFRKVSVQWLDLLLSAEGVETTNVAHIGDFIVVGIAGSLAESPDFRALCILIFQLTSVSNA